MKKGKLLIGSLFICLSMVLGNVVESNAEGASGEQTAAGTQYEDENPQRLQEVTGMNENGEIYQMEDSAGIVEDAGISLFSRSAVGPQVVNFNTKGNAVTNYTEAGTGNAGYTNGAYGADAAYLGTSGGQVKFMLSGVVGWVSASDVQVVSIAQAQALSHYKSVDGRLIHYISQNLNTSAKTSALDNGAAPSYLSAGTTYYSYDGHYFYTDYTVMLQDYQNDSRASAVNAGNPYYNYFQYLPVRSQSGYDAGSLEAMLDGKTTASSKLRGTGSSFVAYQNQYGVNALLMAGIAANESGWGTSSIAMSKNNLFGLNAVDTSPGTSASTYASVDECIRQFAGIWVSKQYANPNNWVCKGGFLGNKASGMNVSYASDPYWGEKAANIAWTLDKLGGNADAQKYTIGIKDTISTSHTAVNVRSEATTASKILYNTGGHSSYAVLILDTQKTNGFYRIQSDAVLSGDRQSVNSGSGTYDFSTMYAYIHSDYVTVVNTGASSGPEPEPDPVTLQSITITSAPVKTVYTEGETADLTGIAVTAQWSDGSSTDVTADITYSQDPLTADTSVITISYTSNGVTVTADQAVTVQKAETSVPDDSVTPPTEDEVTTPDDSVTPPTEDEVTTPDNSVTPPTEDEVTTPDDSVTPPTEDDGITSDDSVTPPTESDGQPTVTTGDESETGNKTDTSKAKTSDVPEKAKAPKTGDANDMRIWLGLLGVSGAGLLIYRRTKKKQFGNIER